MLLAAAQHQDGCRTLGALGLDLELEEAGDVFEDVLPAAHRAIDFEVVVGVDVFDLLHVEEVVARVVFDVEGFGGKDSLVEVLLVGLELVPAWRRGYSQCWRTLW